MAGLPRALADPAIEDEAAENLRSLIERITFTSRRADGTLEVLLYAVTCPQNPVTQVESSGC